MRLTLESYEAQRGRWPRSGRHILAQHDEETVVVYQAYRPSIGRAAVRAGRLGGGGFKLDRMSWIKPNFLWMMYRCGWATKEGQEVVLALGLARHGFDELLAGAVHSSFVAEVYETEDHWQQRLASSSVRLQWDPDHNPRGNKVERRAIQLGLRGASLRRFVEEWVLWIEDVTPLVVEQRALVGTASLVTPQERVYRVADPRTAQALGVSAWEADDDPA